jgi:hypothetical protein
VLIFSSCWSLFEYCFLPFFHSPTSSNLTYMRLPNIWKYFKVILAFLTTSQMANVYVNFSCDVTRQFTSIVILYTFMIPALIYKLHWTTLSCFRHWSTSYTGQCYFIHCTFSQCLKRFKTHGCILEAIFC